MLRKINPAWIIIVQCRQCGNSIQVLNMNLPYIDLCWHCIEKRTGEILVDVLADDIDPLGGSGSYYGN
jgi:hypothetical protein